MSMSRDITRRSRIRDRLCASRSLILLCGAIVAAGVLCSRPRFANFIEPQRMGLSPHRELDQLLLAAERQDEPTFRQLLGHSGLDLDCLDADSMNPLLRTARNGWIDGCRLLLERHAKANVADANGRSPLQYAVLVHGSDAMTLVELLLKHGAEVDHPDRIGETALTLAAIFDRRDIARRLLAAGADVNHHARNGFTALHWAAFCDNPEMSQLLLDAGADPHATDDVGATPADVAQHH